MTSFHGGPPQGARPPAGIAFLLSQLGSLAASAFAESVARQDLTPALAGVLRILRGQPGISQLDLARRLGIAPSRVVGYLDDLERRGWVARTRDPVDRRVNLVVLTDAGTSAFGSLAGTAMQHERTFTEGLTDGEKESLVALLNKLADLRGLTPGVHPGYRTSS